jgi:predicted secreted protein
MSRRQVLAGAGGTGLLAATVSPAKAATRARRSRAAGDGTPEQVHLTWSENPATGVVVSWASAGQARRPRVRIGQRVIPAEPRPYTDGISGETVWTYHARVGGLRPGATYAYAVTADNDSNATDPFSATFRTGTDTADGQRQAKVFTTADRPVATSTPGVFTRAADAVEDAVWSAKRDTATGYGIAVFDVDPGHGSDGQPSIKVTHYHAVGADPVNPGTGAKGAPTPDYTEFETFTLVRPR